MHIYSPLNIKIILNQIIALNIGKNMTVLENKNPNQRW